MADHSPRVSCSIGILGMKWMSKFLHGPFHSFSKMEINATYGGSTVDQGSGFSDFSVFHLVKGNGNVDCSSRCCYKYRLNVCGK